MAGAWGSSRAVEEIDIGATIVGRVAHTGNYTQNVYRLSSVVKSTFMHNVHSFLCYYTIQHRTYVFQLTLKHVKTFSLVNC